MARPTETPEWATDAAAQVTTPPLGKRLLGWVKERPGYQFFNWLFYTLWLWIDYIDSGGHGEVEYQYGAVDGAVDGGVSNPLLINGAYWEAQSGWTTGSVVYFPIRLQPGERIVAIDVHGRENSTASDTWEAKLFRISKAGGTRTQISTTKTSGGGGAAADETIGWTDADAAIPYTAVAGEMYVVEWSPSGAPSTWPMRVYGVDITTDVA